MDGIGNTLIAAVVTFVVGGPVAYYFGLQQSRRQRLEEKRAEVIAGLFRHFYLVQDAFFHWSTLSFAGATTREDIAERHADQGKAAIESLNDLKIYYYSNEPWLTPSTSARVEEDIKLAESIVNAHPADLKKLDFHWTDEGREASNRMRTELPVFMGSLLREFRTFLYPPPWYDAPLRFLAWLQSRNRKDDPQE